jgi:8-oxo-dGTP diphosphatase
LRATGGAFAPNEETDELRWLPPAEAAALLSYDRDREIVDRFVAAGEAGTT